MNFQKYKNFFPQKVYHCSCLNSVIISCLVDAIYSLGDICYKISTADTPFKKIYCSKCGDDKKDVVFSCSDHMAIIIFSVKKYDTNPDKSIVSVNLYDETKSYCKKCVKKYLQKMYYYYRHTIFDLPLCKKT